MGLMLTREACAILPAVRLAKAWIRYTGKTKTISVKKESEDCIHEQLEI
jgi:hypothetical protein